MNETHAYLLYRCIHRSGSGVSTPVVGGGSGGDAPVTVGGGSRGSESPLSARNKAVEEEIQQLVLEARLRNQAARHAQVNTRHETH